MYRFVVSAASAAFFVLALGTASAFDLLDRIAGESPGDQFGTAICTMDFDGDGYSDLIISSPAADESGVSSGKVYVYLGGPFADLVADHSLIGVESSFFGNSLSSAGDFNNDGYDDLLVGAPFYDQPEQNAGAAFLYYCGPTVDTTADIIFTGEAQNDYFGTAVSHAGDFNADLSDDIIIGAYRADYGGFENAGEAYIFYGGSSPDEVPDGVLVGETEGERFGFSASGLDYNGDNFSDVAVGAYSYDDTLLNQGRVYIYYGGPSADTVADLTITGSLAGHKFGHALTSGKVNNDSYADLIMGTDGYSVGGGATGKVYVYFGGVGADAAADFEYSLERTQSDFLGFSVASGADIDSDGVDDILAGMPGNDDAVTEGGGSVIISGGNPPKADTTILGGDSSEEMGKAVAIWEGYGGTQTSIVAFGAPSFDSYRGRVHLYVESVQTPNHAPDLDPIGNKFVAPEETLTFTVTAVDPDLDSVTLYSGNLPSGASFDFEGWNESIQKYTGAFTWTPSIAQEGVYEGVLFAADDGETASEELIRITVGLYQCGDANASGAIDIDDIVYLIAYVFQGGAEPVPAESGDVNCSSASDIDDIVFLIGYVFQGGPMPCDPDGDGDSDC